MYKPYSSNTQRNKSRLYIFLIVAFIIFIIYRRYSSSSNKSLEKGTFQLAGENVDSVIQQSKDKLNNGINNIKDKADNVVDKAKDKIKQGADTVQQAAKDVKQKL
ncbi:unnamed protein product [Adineta steineri]|uniref:Uncharacterized protein n=2 Tax=Adineta steineri TaxID=433720 RepID=A0A818RA84_9BILA|nr:unnamed protein product [Adineta steineri]